MNAKPKLPVAFACAIAMVSVNPYFLQEERFLYPVYPSIFLAAACTLDITVQVRLAVFIIGPSSV